VQDIQRAPNSIKAALFVDFDNIYIGLRKVHPKAAEEFATNPAGWLAWFEQGMPSRDHDGSNVYRHRALLLRHCYLNPRLYGNYRADFTRAAFKVVDCPSLTQQNKNSTDIHMVMDILDVLKLDTRFDEFIILSGDSDFTPVLLRLRLFDRRTVILTPGPVSQPYKAASDLVINEDVFIEDGMRILPERERRSSGAAPIVVGAGLSNEQLLDAMAQIVYEKAVVEGAVSAVTLPSIYTQFPQFKSSNNWLGFYSLIDLTTDLTRRRPGLAVAECTVDGRLTWEVRHGSVIGETQASESATAVVGAPPSIAPSTPDLILRGRIFARVKELVAASPSAVNMAWAASEVIRSLGSQVRSTGWAGAGSFKDLLLAEGARGFEVMTSQFGPGYLIDPSRHTSPIVDESVEDWEGYPEELTAFARRINRVTGAPLLKPDEYALVFKTLEDELEENSYFLTTTSRAVRDRCAELGKSVPRKEISFILKGITYSGHEFEDNPMTDNAEVFALVFKDNVLKLCKGAQLELSEDELKFLDHWIGP